MSWCKSIWVHLVLDPLCFLHRAGSYGKESACSVGDTAPIPELGRFPGDGNGNTPHYSCLGNLLDRGAWWATIHGGRKRAGHNWARMNMCPEPRNLFPSLGWELFSHDFIKYIFDPLHPLFSFWDPIMRRLACLMLSQRSLKLHSRVSRRWLFF